MDSKRASDAPSCGGVSMEKWCQLFAAVNMVLCGACTLGGLAFLGFTVSFWFDGESRSENDMVLVWLFLGISLACSLGSILALAFAVVLWIGVRKNKPEYIKVYLVYGMLVLALSLLGTLGFIFMERDDMPLVLYALIPLGGCVTYAGLLLLVNRTHAMLSTRKAISTPGSLLGDEDP